MTMLLIYCNKLAGAHLHGSCNANVPPFNSPLYSGHVLKNLKLIWLKKTNYTASSLETFDLQARTLNQI